MNILKKIRDLRGKRKALHDEATEILRAADEADGGMTSDQEERFDRIHADIDALGLEVQRLERQLDVERQLRAAEPPAGAAGDDRDPAPTEQDNPEARAAAVREAFLGWVRGGIENLGDRERQIMSGRRRTLEGAELRAQGIATGAAGGFAVPEGFVARVEESMLAIGQLRESVEVFSTASGNDLPWPTVDDTAQTGELLAENTGAAEQDVTFGQIIFKAWKYSSKLVRVSIELLQDEAVDIEGVLARLLGTRIGRITNLHFTTGDDSSKPQGIVTASSVGKTGLTGQTTSIIYDDLVDLEHSIDPAYRNMPGTGWMLHDDTLKAIKKIKDDQSNPIWRTGLAEGDPDSILGYPYFINQDVATMAANAKSVLFGNLKKYMVRDVMDMTMLRLVERYAELGQVGFLIFSRHDGRMLDAGTDPVKHYANSAT